MKEYSLSELRSSIMMYDRNPPRFVIYFTIIVLLSSGVIAVIANSSEKSEVLHSVGVVSDSEKTYITAPISGTISEVVAKEGQHVSPGETVLLIENKEAQLQLKTYEELANYYFKIIHGYQTIETGLQNYDINYKVNEIPENTNPFDKGSQLQYYLFYEAFFKQMNTVVDGDIPEQRQSIIDQGLIDCNQMILQYEPSYTQYRSQVAFFSGQIEMGRVKTESTGQIHLLSNLYVGLHVDKGVALASVSKDTSDQDAESIVTFALSVADRSKINIGSEVQITPYDSLKNGKVIGHISEIASDSTMNQNGASYYSVVVSIDSNDADLRLGMILDCTIVYSKSSWLDWVLDKFGL